MKILNMHRAYLNCNTFEEMYCSLSILMKYLNSQEQKFSLEAETFRKHIYGNIEYAKTECEVLSLKLEERVDLYIGDLEHWIGYAVEGRFTDAFSE